MHTVFLVWPARLVDRLVPWYCALVATLAILCLLNAALLLAWTSLVP